MNEMGSSVSPTARAGTFSFVSPSIHISLPLLENTAHLDSGPHWHRLRFLSPHPTHPGFSQHLKSCLLPASPDTRPPSNHGTDNILHSHVGPHTHHGHMVIHDSPDQHTHSCHCVLPPRPPPLPVDSELSWEEVKIPRRALTAALKSTMASSELFYQQPLCNFLF